MNALPLKTTHSPHAVIDDLIADFGIRPVLIAVAARLFRGRKMMDSKDFPGLATQPGVDDLNNHLRADLGLPPKDGDKLFAEPLLLMRRDFF